MIRSHKKQTTWIYWNILIEVSVLKKTCNDFAQKAWEIKKLLQRIKENKTGVQSVSKPEEQEIWFFLKNVKA